MPASVFDRAVSSPGGSQVPSPMRGDHSPHICRWGTAAPVPTLARNFWTPTRSRAWTKSSHAGPQPNPETNFLVLAIGEHISEETMRADRNRAIRFANGPC